MKNSSYYIAPAGDRTHDLPLTVASDSDSDSDLFYFVSIQHSVTVMYIQNEIIKYADMEAPIKTISGRYHRATRKIN